MANKEKIELCVNEFALDSLFQTRADCISCIEEIDSLSKENKVSLLTGRGINIFNIFVNDIPFLDNASSKMILVKKDIEEDKSLKVKRVLSNKEKNVLKKSRENVSVSSEDFSTDIDDYALEKNEDLCEIEYKVNELIREFDEEKNFNALNQIATKLLNYAIGVALLVEFEDLSYAISSLGELLQTITIDYLDERKHKKTELYLSNIMLDLSNWRCNEFVEQTTNDIRYLDSSLFSTILQFELIRYY